MTEIISAFPACGKTYAAKSKFGGESVLDLDSSTFSWLEPGIRNPDFPENYIKEIKKHTESGDWGAICVSSHDVVRSALEKHNIAYTYITPDSECKHEWLGRCWARGNDESFLKMLNENWDNWVSYEAAHKFSPGKVVWLDSNQTITDYILYMR